MQAHVFGPAPLTLDLHPERSLHDTHWGYHFADCRWFPLTVTYRPTARRPLVTVLQDAAGGTGAPGPRVTHRGHTLTVTLAGDAKVRFRFTNGHWTLT
jgi:hypothetical protein